MSFLEDLTFAQALMLLAAIAIGGSWGRRWVKHGGSLRDRVCRLEIEVQRLADQAGQADGGEES